MQKNLPADLSDVRTPEARADELTTGSAPVELDLAVLKHVAGGGPNGNWKTYSSLVTTDGPNGTWR